jgi:stage V sporulation protein B
VFPLLGGQILLNVLFQADALLLRRFASDAALAAAKNPEIAGELVGAYRAAQLFCFLPYQLLLAITFILFPLLATARHQGDVRAVASYVSNGMRLALILGGVMVSVNGGLHGQLINLVFGADAAALGGGAMQILALGLGSFAIFGILTSVLNSLGKEGVSALVTLLAAIFVGGACLTTVPGTAYGPQILQKTALATSLGLIGATVLAAVFVYKTAGALMPLRSFLRILLATGVALVVGRMLPPQGKLLAIVYAAVVALVYVTLLLVTRELGKEDLRVLRKVARRG